MLVKEIMSKNVITINQHKTVLEASKLYQEYKVGCLVVVNEQRNIVGIVTERDFIERTICLLKNPETTLVSDIMSTNILTIHALDTVDKALQLMKNHDVKKLPVLYNEGLAGIITVTDISRARPALSKRFMDTWVKPEWED